MLKSLFHKVTVSTSDPKQMRLKQHLLLGSVVGIGLLVTYFVQGSSPSTVDPKVPSKKELVPLTTPLDAINPQDVWAGRIQKEAEEAKSEAKAVREENQLLAKKMELMEKILQGSATIRQGKLNPGSSQSFAPPLLDEAPLARSLHKQKEEQQLGQKIRTLAKSTGLFFVFSSTCPHCHSFAPVVKQFAQDHGFEIKAISKDGASLKEFSEVSKDNGMIARLNPQGIYPALFLAHPPSGQVIPVAWGMANSTQLLENFATVIKALEEKIVHGR